MCTLTVVTGDNSYRMAMNRDEKIIRGSGMPPEIHELGSTKAIYPSDGDGGTWIAANEYGIALALLNWHDVVARSVGTSQVRSRGQLIPALIDSQSLPQLQAVFGALDLEGMSPFRLVGVFPSEKQIWEWRWNSAQREVQVHAWESRHWFSSSLSDKQAESLRGAACCNAWTEPDAGSTPWVRRLHASHTGGAGAFSLCVHRGDVKTLSYTEVTCGRATVETGHILGSPCAMGPGQFLEIGRTGSVHSRSGNFDSLPLI